MILSDKESWINAYVRESILSGHTVVWEHEKHNCFSGHYEEQDDESITLFSVS